MPFDRAIALAEAEDCERRLQILYHSLRVPFVTMKLLDGALVVRCENEDDLPAMCQRVADEYTPEEGITIQ